MYKPLILIILLLSSSFAVLDVSSIDASIEETGEKTPKPTTINYIPFKEIATIIIDQKNDKVKISYSLMSKDKKDFQISDELETKVLDSGIISTIVYTNTEKCAVGVINATCIMINIPLNQLEGTDFKEKQKVAREISDSIINDLNQTLGINTKYHSVSAQTSVGLTNEEGVILNVVYTMNNLPSKLLFNMLILENIREDIRLAGGFLNNAKELANDENSVFTFSMSTEAKRLLYSLHISVTSSGKIGLNNFNPLGFLDVDELNRSKLFAEGFYPLNSIVNVIIFSEEKLQVEGTNSTVIGSLANADELQKNGWYFISSVQEVTSEINKLDLRYLFGKTNSVDKQELLLTIGPIVEDVTPNYISQNDVLPVGVESLAPNFEGALTFEWTITALYEEIGNPKKNYVYTWGMDLLKSIPHDAKIIKGDGTELLVFHLHIPNNDDTSVTFYPEHFKMYDGKDRVFDSLTYEIENTTSWSEDCPINPVVIQPGIGKLMKLCFEIPKDADHFKIVTSLPSSSGLDFDRYYDIVAIFDRPGIGEDALPQPSEETTTTTDDKGGGCLMATAAFGSEIAPQVQFLREIRDNTVLQTESGSTFMTGFNQFYYSFSPAIADYERENPAFKEVVKLSLTPLLTSLTLLQYADIDSESEMLGYGIGVILLNIGMYFVAPAVLIMTVRKRI